MTDLSATELTRYSRLLFEVISSPVSVNTDAEAPGTVRVEQGVAFPLALRPILERPRIERYAELAPVAHTRDVQVVDRLGHRRPAYRGLLVYSWLRAFYTLRAVLPTEMSDPWTRALTTWTDPLRSSIAAFGSSSGAATAARGATVAEAAWDALALVVAGSVVPEMGSLDLPVSVFTRLAAGQADSGAFLTAGASDNPEVYWYHELVLLHAVASYAVVSRDEAIYEAVRRAASYHVNETQLDHATTQPWALLAFLTSRRTAPAAEELLHAAGTNLTGISLVLLADALYGIGQWVGGNNAPSSESLVL